VWATGTKGVGFLGVFGDLFVELQPL
jgi:hypothetical protein